jgi:predicted short-subunit dehydrogenase-like oxidoreductase (DUF2520 family)
VPRLNVIGTGRVGQALAHLWQRQGLCEVQDLMSRHPERTAGAARFIGGGRVVSAFDALRPAGLWMVTVPDAQVATVAASLAAFQVSRGPGDLPGPAPVVFHCSGFLPASALAPLQALGWQAASAHPVLNFASPRTGVEQFAGTPCGLEGDAPAKALLRTLLQALDAICFDVAEADKPLYHGAAVIASNFLVVLQAMAREAWAEAGVPPALIPTVNAALVRATLENTLALGPAGAIVGPAARGDPEVVQRQGDCIADWHPEAGQVYRAMSVLARRLAVTGTTLPAPAAGAPPQP